MTRLRKRCVLALVACALALPGTSSSQSAPTNQSSPSKGANPMVGTWRLLAVHSWKDKDKKDLDKLAYGPHPGGLITYTADGRMSVLETYDNRKPLSGDREAAPMAERAAAFSSMVAYAGSYKFEGDKVIHYQEVAAVPMRPGAPNRGQVRYVIFQDQDHVSLRTPPVMRNGVEEIHEMFWERVK